MTTEEKTRTNMQKDHKKDANDGKKDPNLMYKNKATSSDNVKIDCRKNKSKWKTPRTEKRA
jgi:hypothetical protein